MKSYTTKQNSWHYKLANFGDENLKYYNSINFCEYLRFMALGIFKFIAMLVFCVSIFCFVAYASYGIILSLFAWDYTKMNMLSMMLVSIFGFFIILYLIKKVNVYLENKPQKESNSFAALAYRKFKTKTCFNIEFEKNDD